MLVRTARAVHALPIALSRYQITCPSGARAWWLRSGSCISCPARCSIVKRRRQLCHRRRRRLSRVFDALSKTSIQPRSTVHTDGNTAYNGLVALGYQHEATILNGRKKDAATELLPRVHRVASLLATTLADRHPPGHSPPTLPRLLPRRIHLPLQPPHLAVTGQALLPHRLLQQAMQVEPTPYRLIVTTAAKKIRPQHLGVGGVNWITMTHVHCTLRVRRHPKNVRHRLPSKDCAGGCEIPSVFGLIRRGMPG
jgi:hypothetical protein